MYTSDGAAPLPLALAVAVARGGGVACVGRVVSAHGVGGKGKYIRREHWRRRIHACGAAEMTTTKFGG